jgi:hypothetical protein
MAQLSRARVSSRRALRRFAGIVVEGRCMLWRAFPGPACCAAIVGSVMLGCGGDLPRPRYSPQTTAALTLVGYPAPPARVEFIPPRPTRESVWLDGEWAWTGSKWAWEPGRWVAPPAGATFSPWTTVRDDRGSIYFASGVWKDAQGQALPPPIALATGRARPGDITSSEGDDEKTGPAPAKSESPHGNTGADAQP